MTSSRVDLQSSIYNVIVGDTTKGFLDNSTIESIRNSSSYGSVLKGMEYRPDLLAEYYLGDSKYAWALIVANNFTNGIEDFTLGRKILLPNLS